MSYALIFFAILALLLAYALKHALAQERAANPFDGRTALPYTARPIMTPTELKVYDRLLRALPDYMVFAQVQVSRVVESPPQNNQYWFNRINRMSYDFVVCRTDGTPVAAIEIDDDTHALPERQDADLRKNAATAAAGIAMLRWQVRTLPNVAAIQKIIRQSDKAA